jgi:drug/metabolite transporter (DMT)-like permease
MLKINITKYQLSTIAGVLAILLWGSNIAFSKNVLKVEGNYNGAFFIYFFSGIFNFILMMIIFGKKVFLQKLKSLPFTYYYKTGIFFILNNILLFVALGFAKTNKELIIVAIINYLWPILIYIFKIPIFKPKVKPIVLVSALVCVVSGLLLVFFQEYNFVGILQMLKFADDNIWAYLIAFLTAVSWAIYSNMIKKYNSTDDIAAIPVIFIFSGLVFALFQLINGNINTLNFTSLYKNLNLIFVILGPTSLGYLFWYFAMKQGNKNLIISLSYFIPVISILMISYIYSYKIEILFWIGTILIICGAILSYKSIVEKKRVI